MAHERFFYSGQIDAASKEAILSGEEHHHLSRVLRMRPDDLIHVGDRAGTMYACRIRDIGVSETRVGIEEIFPGWGEEKLDMHLAVGLIRESHWEWMIEKAVELGVTEITPLLTEHVLKRSLRSERSEKIIFAAAKQCGRSRVPRLNAPAEYRQFIKEAQADTRICFDNQGSARPYGELLPLTGQSVILLVGPEGGFSKQEVDFAEKNDYFSAILGSRRLRTETAALTAVALSPGR